MDPQVWLWLRLSSQVMTHLVCRSFLRIQLTRLSSNWSFTKKREIVSQFMLSSPPTWSRHVWPTYGWLRIQSIAFSSSLSSEERISPDTVSSALVRRDHSPAGLWRWLGYFFRSSENHQNRAQWGDQRWPYDCLAERTCFAPIHQDTWGANIFWGCYRLCCLRLHPAFWT